MPELPDLLHVVARLSASLSGRAVTAERLREPVVLRFTVRGNLSLLLGRTLREVGRHSHWILLRFEGLDLVVNPMLAGRFRLAPPGEPDEKSLAFALAFGDVELRYLDEKKMGKAFLVAAGDFQAIAGFHTGAVDVLSAEFTRERFISLLRHRRDQVRVFLLDKKALDSIGNAYADEILFAAGIHPKTWCRALGHDEAVRLHDAIVSVIREAAAEVARRDEPPEVKVRDFLRVRLREVCPRCGDKLRVAGVKGMDAYFCPHCQPPTRPAFVDWSRTGG
jgi:formamidopyrimidine-DNA glycosylase